MIEEVSVAVGGILAVAAFASYGILYQYIYRDIKKKEKLVADKADKEFEEKVSLYNEKKDPNFQRSTFMKALRRTVAIKDKVRAGLRAGNIALAIAIFSFILVMLSLFPIIQPQMQNNQLTVNNSTQQSQQQTVELGGWIFIQFAIFLIIFNMLLGLAVYFDKITIDGYLEGKDLEILLKEGEY